MAGIFSRTLVAAVSSPYMLRIKAINTYVYGFTSTPEWNRTIDLRFRKPLLYPLSYRGISRYMETTCNNLILCLLFMFDTQYDTRSGI